MARSFGVYPKTGLILALLSVLALRSGIVIKEQIWSLNLPGFLSHLVISPLFMHSCHDVIQSDAATENGLLQSPNGDTGRSFL